MRRLVVLALLAVCATAYADDPGRAEKFFRAGEKAYQAQDFAAAAQDFDFAYESLPVPEIAFSAAQAYRKLYYIQPKPEYLKRAIDLFRAYLDKRHEGGRISDAATAVGELQRELDRLIASGVKVPPKLAAEHTWLGISVSLGGLVAETGSMKEIQEGAVDSSTNVVVTIDGARQKPFTLKNVEPGKHKITAEAVGYTSVAREEFVAQGANVMAEVKLEPKPAHLELSTERDARITVDGRPLGTAPMKTIELPAGKHMLEIEHRGRQPIVRELVLARDQTAKLDQPLEQTFRRRLVPWFALGAAGFGVLAASAATYAIVEDRRASKLLDTIQKMGNQPQSVLDDFESHRVSRNDAITAMWPALAIAVGLGTTAMVLYYTDNPSPERMQLAPTVSSSGGGVVISASF